MYFRKKTSAGRSSPSQPAGHPPPLPPPPPPFPATTALSPRPTPFSARTRAAAPLLAACAPPRATPSSLSPGWVPDLALPGRGLRSRRRDLTAHLSGDALGEELPEPDRHPAVPPRCTKDLSRPFSLGAICSPAHLVFMDTTSLSFERRRADPRPPRSHKDHPPTCPR